MSNILDEQKKLKNTYDFFRHLLKNRLINDYKDMENVSNDNLGQGQHIRPDQIINIFHPNILSILKKEILNKDITNLKFYSNDGFDMTSFIDRNKLPFKLNNNGTFDIFDFFIEDNLLIKYDHISNFFSLEYQDNLEFDNKKVNSITENSRYSEYTFNKREEKPTFNPILKRDLISNTKTEKIFNYYYGENRNNYFEEITDIEKHKDFNSILTATTGSGKTTEIPLFLLEFGFSKYITDKKIIVTQPRQIAASDPASYMAFLMDMPRKIIYNDYYFNNKQLLKAKYSNYLNYEIWQVAYNKNESKENFNKDIHEDLEIKYKYLIGNENNSSVIFTHPTENIYEIIESQYYIPIYDYYFMKKDNTIISSLDKIDIESERSSVDDENLVLINKTYVGKKILKEPNKVNYYILKNYWDNFDKKEKIKFSNSNMQKINNDEIKYNSEYTIGTTTNNYCYYKSDKNQNLYLFDFANYINLENEVELQGRKGEIYNGKDEKIIKDFQQIDFVSNKYIFEITGESQSSTFHHRFNYKKSHFCFLKNTLMVEPVLASDGEYYEKNNLIEKLESGDITSSKYKLVNGNYENLIINNDINDLSIDFKLKKEIETYKKYNRFFIKDTAITNLEKIEFQVIDVTGKNKFIIESDINLEDYRTSIIDYGNYNSRKLLSNKVYLDINSDLIYFDDTDIKEFRINLYDNRNVSNSYNINNYLPYIRIFDPKTRNYKLRFSKIYRFKHNLKPSIEILTDPKTGINSGVLITYHISFIDEPYTLFNIGKGPNGMTIVNEFKYNSIMKYFERVNNNKTELQLFLESKKEETFVNQTLNELVDIMVNIPVSGVDIDEDRKLDQIVAIDGYEAFISNYFPLANYSIKSDLDNKVNVQLKLFNIITEISDYISYNEIKNLNNSYYKNLIKNNNEIKEMLEIKIKEDIDSWEKCNKDYNVKGNKKYYDVIRINYSDKNKISNLQNRISIYDIPKNNNLIQNLDSFKIFQEYYNEIKNKYKFNNDDEFYELQSSKIKIIIDSRLNINYYSKDFMKILDRLKNLNNNNLTGRQILDKIKSYFVSSFQKYLNEPVNKLIPEFDTLNNLIHNVNRDDDRNELEKRMFTSSTFEIDKIETIPVNLTSAIGISFQGKYETVELNYEKTYLDLITDGTFLNKELNNIKNNKKNKRYQMDNYSCVLIDEAHERTVACEYIMAILNNYVKKERKLPFRSIIMSATIGLDLFKNYFNTDNTLHIGGNTFGKNIFYNKYKASIDTVIINIIENILNKSYLKNEEYETIPENDDLYEVKDKDILIFLATISQIENLSKLISKNSKFNNLKVLELYSKLSDEEKKEITNEDVSYWSSKDKKKYTKRVVITTNIAETSLTIKDITYAIDSGLQNIVRTNPINNSSTSNVLPTSVNSIIQRLGRVGRSENGCYFPIFNKDFFDIKYYMDNNKIKNNNLKIQLEPAIEITDSTTEIFKLLQIGLIKKPSDILNNKFPLLSTPNYELFTLMLEKLKKYNLIKNENNQIIINKDYIKYLELDLSYNAIIIIKKILENNYYRNYLRAIICLLIIIDRKMSIHNFGGVSGNLEKVLIFNFFDDYYMNELKLLYYYVFDMLSSISIDGFKEGSVFINIQKLSPKGVAKEIYKQIPIILKLTENTLDIISKIENLDKNINYGLYNFNVLGYQSKILFNEEFNDIMHLCLINGYNNNIYEKDKENKMLYKSVNDDKKKLTYKGRLGDASKINDYKKFEYQYSPDYIYVFEVQNNIAVDNVIHFSKKIYNKFLENKI
jgi:hypothetical protein